MHKTLLLLTLFSLFSCSHEQKEETVKDSTTILTKEDMMALEAEVEEEDSDSIRQLKLNVLKMRLPFEKVNPFFALQHIQEIKEVPSSEELAYRRLTATEYFEAFQDSSAVYYDAQYEGAYYYSNQGEKNGIKRYIFIKLDETCCVNYYYNTYDLTGKKISSCVIASSGGDGGWTTHATCTLPNDSTILQTDIDCEYGVDSKNDEVGDCDSILTSFHVFANGTVSRKLISTHKIIKK